jgi:hypothetical protein
VSFQVLILICVVYAVVGVRMLRDVWHQRATVFDHHVTPPERMQLQQAAFFIVIPFSVALHELGHAIAVWAFGGEVVDFGFYFFAGFVSYAEPFTDLQHLIVTAAGTIVNIILGLLILGFVFLKRPSLSPAWNELLITGAVLQGANALIFYPLLDFATGMNGDWSQMYASENGAWRLAVFAVQAGFLALAWYLNKRQSFRLRLGQLTGYPSGVERGLLGSIATAGRRPTKITAESVAVPPKRLTLVEERMVASADRVASGWPGTVHHRLRSNPSASELLMIWSDGVTGVVRIAALRGLPDGSGEIWGLLFSGDDQNSPLRKSRIQRWDAFPEDDDLTMALRVSMERIARWPVPVDASQVSG